MALTLADPILELKRGWFDPTLTLAGWFCNDITATGGPPPAPAFSHILTQSDTSNLSTYTTGSFTPVAGSLLVYAFLVSGATTDPATVTASANGITFSKYASAVRASVDTVQLWVADQVVPASPVTMTVSVGVGAAGSGIQGYLHAITDATHAGAAAVRGAGGRNQATAATPTVSLGAAALTGNIVIGWFFNATNPAGITQPASFTEGDDSGYSTPTRGGEYAYRSSGHTSSSVTWGSTTASACATLAVEIDTSAAALGGAVTVAAETDTALTIGRRKTLTLGTVVDTSAALTITGSLSGGGHVQAVGTATETDTAVAIGRQKTRTLGVSSDTETGQPVGRRKTRAVGTASDTETSLPVGHSRARGVGIAAETDTSQSIARRKTKAVGVAADTSTAQLVGRRKTRTVGVASDTSTAVPLARVKRRLVGVASDVASALPVGRRKTGALGSASEADTAGPVTSSGHTQPVGTVTSPNTALAVGRRKTRSVAAAGESDTGGVVGRVKRRALGVATSSNTGLGVTTGRRRTVGTASSTSTGGVIGRSKRRLLGTAVETDTGGLVRAVYVRAIQVAVEFAQALPIVGQLIQGRDITVVSIVEVPQLSVTFTEPAQRTVGFTAVDRLVAFVDASRVVTFTEPAQRAITFEEQPQ